MSFFDQFAQDGKKVDGSKENTVVQTSNTIPGGTKAKAIIEEMKWDEYEGHRKVKVRWKLADTSFKGKVTFQNIELFAVDFNTKQPDPKKAFRAANVLKRLFMLTGVPIPDVEPTDADFAQMVGKMAGIGIELWENDQGKNGNWISEIQPTKDFESKDGDQLPNATPQNTGVAQQSLADDGDDW